MGFDDPEDRPVSGNFEQPSELDVIIVGVDRMNRSLNQLRGLVGKIGTPADTETWRSRLEITCKTMDDQQKLIKDQIQKMQRAKNPQQTETLKKLNSQFKAACAATDELRRSIASKKKEYVTPNRMVMCTVYLFVYKYVYKYMMNDGRAAEGRGNGRRHQIVVQLPITHRASCVGSYAAWNAA